MWWKLPDLERLASYENNEKNTFVWIKAEDFSTVHLYFAFQQPVWYHRQFQRVTSIEDCDVSDMTCRYLLLPSQY